MLRQRPHSVTKEGLKYEFEYEKTQMQSISQLIAAAILSLALFATIFIGVVTMNCQTTRDCGYDFTVFYVLTIMLMISATVSIMFQARRLWRLTQAIEAFEHPKKHRKKMSQNISTVTLK
ncbi:hypothetical protein KJ765_02780 [Candidatus Micrarchaeota archaeon]|nr:hypothetical protein [Candidatus Micrarchaeota archaeon]